MIARRSYGVITVCAIFILIATACGGGGSQSERGILQKSDRGPGMKREVLGARQLPVPRTFDLTHGDPKHFAVALGNDPVRIFEFLRDSIAYEAYPGLLRGPKGTLLALAGNSVDRAALLGNMIENSGHRVRYVHGTLSEQNARELVASMWAERPRLKLSQAEGNPPSAISAAMQTLRSSTERDYDLIRNHLKQAGKPAPRDPAPSFDSMVSEARDHFWVQWLRDGRWVDLDPSFLNAGLGQTFGKTLESLTALPDTLFHRITLRVRLEEYTGQEPSNREILTYAANAADLSGTDVILAYQPENWRGPDFTSAIVDTGRVKPVLIVGGQLLAGEPFLPKLKTTGIGSIPNLLGGEGTRKDVAIASAAWLDIEFVGPGGQRETVVRELFDLVGKGRRATGVRLSKDELRSKTENTVDVVSTIYHLFFTSGRIETTHFVDLSDEPPLGDPQQANLTTFLRRIHVAFVATSDALLTRLTRPGHTSVLFYPDSPRVQIIEFSTIGEKYRISMDLRRSRVRAAVIGSHPEDAYFARIFRGVLEGTLERVLMEYVANPVERSLEQAFGTSALFDRVIAERIQTVLLTDEKVNLNGIGEDTSARIREDLASGYFVVAPERPIVVGQVSRFAWWRLDPRSGEVTAVADTGLHAGMIESYQIQQQTQGPMVYVVAVTTSGFKFIVDAAIYGTPYYIAMMNRICNGLTPWSGGWY